MESKPIYLRVSKEEEKKFDELSKHYVRSKRDQFRFMLREAYEKMEQENASNQLSNLSGVDLEKTSMLGQLDQGG